MCTLFNSGSSIFFGRSSFIKIACSEFEDLNFYNAIKAIKCAAVNFFILSSKLQVNCFHHEASLFKSDDELNLIEKIRILLNKVELWLPQLSDKWKSSILL
jgi:hypothetical protein